MTDTTASSAPKVPASFGGPPYAPGTHPDLPSPVRTEGPIFWVRKNLLSSPLNILLTVLAALFILYTVPSFLDWAIFDAAFTGDSRKDCEAIASGACWAFIHERFSLFVYGFYPEPERWRVNLSFVLLLLTLYFVLYDKAPFRKYGLWYAVAFPFIAGWLLVGDGTILTTVTTDQFGGIMLTLVIGVTGIAFSLPLGILLALGRYSDLPVVRLLCICFIEFIRGVPLITILFVASTMLNYFLPPGTQFDLLLRVLIMVTLFSAAYIAEVVRGGLQAIPKGQFEAADSLGLKYWSAMRLVILPQALKISIPGIVNSFIELFKDTTLVLIIGLLDPLGIGRASLADIKWGGLAEEVYVFIALFFFLCCFSMSRYSLYLEKKLHTGHKR
jgi:general L-amino acid transport system permease protein